MYKTANDYYNVVANKEYGKMVLNVPASIIPNGEGQSVSVLFSNPDYYYCVVENPVLDNQEVFESLLCVSAFSSQAKRSIEMIQELMTNSTRSGLLNTLLYGVAQENYTLEDGVVRFRLNYNYAMHPDYMVGNLAETAYPCSNYGQNSKTYDNVVQQNKDMAKRVPLFDATYERYFEYVDVEKWNDMDELSDNYFAELMACADLAAYRAKVEEIKLALTPIEKPRDEANPDDPTDPFNSPENQFALAFMGMVDPYLLPPSSPTPKTLGSAFFAYIYDKTQGKTLQEKPPVTEEEGEGEGDPEDEGEPEGGAGETN